MQAKVQIALKVHVKETATLTSELNLVENESDPCLQKNSEG